MSDDYDRRIGELDAMLRESREVERRQPVWCSRCGHAHELLQHDEEPCTICGEPVYVGMMPRHMAKDHDEREELAFSVTPAVIRTAERTGALLLGRFGGTFTVAEILAVKQELGY